MSWKPIIAGVDQSDEGIRAAVVALRLAALAGCECHLVHVTHDVSNIPASFHLPVDLNELRHRVSEQARSAITEALINKLPDIDLECLEVRLGTTALGLVHATRYHEAGLVVLGRTHHKAPARWFGGTTAHHTVRTIDVPILLASEPLGSGLKILVAVDLTYATGPTLELARRFHELLNAELMILHVAEPLPVVPDVTVQMDEYAHYPSLEARFERDIRASLNGNFERAEVRRGHANKVVRATAREWKADLVMVGSHGKNWADRVILGSTTERLINQLETSLVVVPVRAPKAATTTVIDRKRMKQST